MYIVKCMTLLSPRPQGRARYEKKPKVSKSLFSTFFISSQFGKKLNACYDVHEAIVKFMTPGSEQIYNIGKIY